MQAHGRRYEVFVNINVPEEFKPIPVRAQKGIIGRLIYGIRLIVDLQLLTCIRFLRPHLSTIQGTVLDVGCGEMPFRSLMPDGVYYTGLDVPAATSFGMRSHSNIVFFDGINIPFADFCYDTLLCTEVLEHAIEPDSLVSEMYRVLKKDGILLVTVPFSARVHHAPYDFHRFTKFRLALMFSKFKNVKIIERGNDITSVSNKLIVICARLVTQRNKKRLTFNAIILIILVPITIISLACAHLSLALDSGSKNDPLGYGIIARKG